MTVVSDTSPISNLAAIGHLDLLQQVYGSITIPQAVADEIAKVATIYAQAASIPDQPWITIQFKQSMMRQLWKDCEVKSLIWVSLKQLHWHLR